MTGDFADAAAVLEKDVDTLAKDVDEIGNDLITLEARMASFEARIAALEHPAPPHPPPPPSPQLVFVEEWDTGLDPARWEMSLWGLRTNKPNELQSYLPSQVIVADGLCTLRAERGKANPDGMPWVSGIVSTRKRLSWLGGRFEVRAKLPPLAVGGWPGIWLFPASGDWYADGEIDFGEALSQTPARYSANVHWHTDPANHAGHMQAQKWIISPTGQWLNDDFHVYGCEWTPGERVTFTFDGIDVHEVTSATATIPATPMYLIIDLSISAGDGKGGWGKPPDASTPPVFDMVIDRVAVWQ